MEKRPSRSKPKPRSQTADAEALEPSAGAGPSPSAIHGLGAALIFTALAMAAAIGLIGFNQKFWLLPPEEKLESQWQDDLQLLRSVPSAKASELIGRVAKIRLRGAGNTPLDDWLPRVRIPLATNPSGDLIADIFVVHQIEGHRYGVIIQYEFIETKTNNKIGEFARTLWLGVYY